MNDDELRSALSRRASASLGADEKRDILRAARAQALQPGPRRSLMPRLAGLVAGIAAVLVLVLIASPILLSPPRLAAPSGSALADGTHRTSPAATAVPQPAGIQVYDAEELSKMVGDPAWMGKMVLVRTTLAAVTGPPNAFESPGVFACEPPNACRLASIVDRQIPVLVGWRDTTADDGIQYDDGNGYRWLKRLDVPSTHGTYAFVVRSNAVEYLGPAVFAPGDQPWKVDTLPASSETTPTDKVYVVHGWWVEGLWPSCPVPQAAMETPRPDLSFYCSGPWLTDESRKPATMADQLTGLKLDSGPYPAWYDEGGAPVEGVYLIRSAGCQITLDNNCPVWRMVGRLDDNESEPLPSPSIEPSSPATDAVAIPTASPWPSADSQSPHPCAAAVAWGTLVKDDVLGVTLESDNGNRMKVVWPYGYFARRDGDRIALLDANGKVLPHTGDYVYLGGGELPDGSWDGCGQIIPGALWSPGRPEPSAGHHELI
jgi:hypothetical protein